MPKLPSFFYNGPLVEDSTVTLDADTAKHIWQVLRMVPDDKILLTDGKGSVAEGHIHVAERHKCNVSVGPVSYHPRQGGILHLAVGFTKNNSRNEWLLEKATELGVGTIVPLIASRSEKTHIRHDRWHKILQSAVLQSQQYYIPVLTETMPFKTVMQQYGSVSQKFVAHCFDDGNKRPISEMLKPAAETILLIGPEGDFTPDEVNLCAKHGFTPVSLGTQRLRTETAAIAAAAWFNLNF